MPTSTSVKSGAHRLGPGIAVRLDLRHAAVGATPALARQLRQRLGGRTIDHHLDVVERPVGMARGIDALGVLRRMGGGVPAPDREVEAAGESHRIVDHDDLLVLRAAEGDRVVDAERHALRRPPAQRQARQELAFAGIEQGIVPQQEMDVQVGARPHQIPQEVGEIAGQAVGRVAVGADELRAAVDVPADHHDAALGLQASAAHRLEEGGSVDQDGGPGGPLDPPDIVVRPQEIHRPSTCGQANGCAMHLTPPRRPGEAIVEVR